MIWRLKWQLTMWFTPPPPRKRYQAATATAAAIIATATAAAIIATASAAFARVDTPLLPTALVEDVKSAAGEVEFMDYVGIGQVIRLAPRDVLVLSYLKSCAHETITGGASGGSVTVGSEASEVQGAQIVRTKVACDGGKIRLSSQQASKSAASTFRVQSAEIEPTLFARAPIVKLPKTLPSADRTLVIARTDRPGERRAFAIDEASAAAGFFDLAKINVSLARGGIYDASVGGYKLTFQIAAKAKSGPAPAISRLLRLQ
jgi:hypothetical protein